MGEPVSGVSLARRYEHLVTSVRTPESRGRRTTLGKGEGTDGSVKTCCEKSED